MPAPIRFGSSIALVALLSFGLATSVADAGPSVLATAAALRFDRNFNCFAVNIGDRDLTITTEIVNGVEDVEFANPSPVTISPGGIASIGFKAGDGSGVLYGRFTVTAGSKTTLQGSYCVDETSNPVCQAVGDAR